MSVTIVLPAKVVSILASITSKVSLSLLVNILKKLLCCLQTCRPLLWYVIACHNWRLVTGIAPGFMCGYNLTLQHALPTLTPSHSHPHTPTLPNYTLTVPHTLPTPSQSHILTVPLDNLTPEHTNGTWSLMWINCKWIMWLADGGVSILSVQLVAISLLGKDKDSDL